MIPLEVSPNAMILNSTLHIIASTCAERQLIFLKIIINTTQTNGNQFLLSSEYRVVQITYVFFFKNLQKNTKCHKSNYNMIIKL